MHTSFQTTNGKGLDRNSVPMKLWEKAKKYGVWNPAQLNFEQDAKDFAALSEDEQQFILQPIAQFQAGEEAVTLDLLPLIMVVANEGRLEEEMFLTSFLWEEAKHIDGFNRFLNTVLNGELPDMGHLLVPSYKTIFYDILPSVMGALKNDSSPVNQARASVTYNMIVEGVLAETGYHLLQHTLDKIGIMPGMREFTVKLKQDESRHVAYGIYLISRLVSEHGDEVWEAVETQMNMLLPLAVNVVIEGYSMWDEIPFGLDPNQFQQYAIDQFQKRFARIQKARNQSLAEVVQDSLSTEILVS
jgi:ribonucleoside-diphosphate reductase beta chain